MDRKQLGVLAAIAPAAASRSTPGPSFANETHAKPDRVIAIYFHRTERCPAFNRMRSYSEEAFRKGFAKPMEDGLVEFRMIDYEKKENAALAKAYQATGPAIDPREHH